MHKPAWLTLGSLALVTLAAPVAEAACTLTPGAGNDAYRCDSGSASSLTALSGDNSLVLPPDGTGEITGDVTFGPGADTVEIASGRIGGNVNQGAGIDVFRMSAGLIEGGVNQGDGLDRFYMTGGRIVGTFDSGDYAEMEGGQIGNVNMRLDKNRFIMRGGEIERNLITGFDEDYIEVFDGRIGGNISVSGGNDQVLIHGGSIGGDVLLSTGNDQFTWDGGILGGGVDLGPGDDTARLISLPGETLQTVIDGGLGNDRLTFEASQPAGGGLYRQFEQVALTQASRMTLDDALVLGDPATGSGTFEIDASSTVASRSGSLRPFTTGRNVSVVNAGTLDLRGGNDAQGRLEIQGDYTGNGGTLRVNSVLAGDEAPSDRLVVSQGRISGSTTLLVDNLNGAGAVTQLNGIQVVEARDGATSTAGALVQTQVLSVGAYDYRLFKGGVTAGSENSWYLRSTLPAVTEPPVAPEPEQPVDPGTDPDPEPTPPPVVQAPIAAPAPGQAPLPTTPAVQAVPLYRPEVAVYAAAPRGAGLIARQTLGSFHQRQGDQRLLQGDGGLPASWGQAYGGTLRQQWSGTVTPSLDGDFYGFKVGQDLYAWAEGGYRQQVGVYVGHGRLEGDVKGFALGRQDTQVGDLRLDGDSAGLYWTLVTPGGAYVDAVLQYTDLDGRARSDRGQRIDLDGDAWTASLEAGRPLPLSDHWTVEPQAQVIAQKTNLHSTRDSASHIGFDSQPEVTGRLGVRLEGRFASTRERIVQPYLQMDVLHTAGGRDTVVFDRLDRIKTDYRQTAAQAEIGVVGQISDALSVHAGVRYSANLDAREQEASGGNVGVRWQF
ncbi:autotransporter family protein [Pseudomonas alabamensis]|uniref:autotransporter family protein n=1 Tax=Pseudomonas alabamensis TaxID=3064349 RepID=UPI000745D8BA|nr:autotransporter outer membrane beta-barrel domain-containing protein [Pseudomonas monteilii]